MIAKIQKWGNSHGIRIPQHILSAISVGEDHEVDISVKGNAVIIRPCKTPKKVSIEELFLGYDGDYMPVECETEKPLGKEVW